MRVDGTDPFAAAKPDARLIKLLIRARRFNAALIDSDGVSFAVPADPSWRLRTRRRHDNGQAHSAFVPVAVDERLTGFVLRL
jgi:hypothetical protein